MKTIRQIEQFLELYFSTHELKGSSINTLELADALFRRFVEIERKKIKKMDNKLYPEQMVYGEEIIDIKIKINEIIDALS